jgi:hypothetical protein
MLRLSQDGWARMAMPDGHFGARLALLRRASHQCAEVCEWEPWLLLPGARCATCDNCL